MATTNNTNQPAEHYCIALAANVGPEHRCATCFLDSRYQDELRTTALLRSEVARLNAALTRKGAEACEAREALQIANRKIQRLTGEKDVISEAFDAAREMVEVMERERDRRDAQAEYAEAF